ncbi:hypothetical protein [Pinirhizobacter soli]|uniref:hypothetical protein n=1 Tax=Pinirhizobacter soli TaxID=2786953 RepID=UPI00202AB939|nr:hypothetical protein [Pinirhizobacter soli]
MEAIAVPSKEDTADAIISQALVPVMLELATRARQTIELGAQSLPPHATPEKRYRVGEGAAESVVAKGEARIILWGAAYRYIFSLEAIFARLALDCGLSGVTIRGKIDWTEGRPVVDVFGQSNRHDRWEWSREFRPDAHEHVHAHQVRLSKPTA